MKLSVADRTFLLEPKYRGGSCNEAVIYFYKYNYAGGAAGVAFLKIITSIINYY